MYLKIFLFLLLSNSLHSQIMHLEGSVLNQDNKPIPYANILDKQNNSGAVCDKNGNFKYEVKADTIHLHISALGFQTLDTLLASPLEGGNFTFKLRATPTELDQMVVTGTRTEKRRTNSPIIVNVLTSSSMENAQSCSVSEGLKFQPGLRVETDCQTCNYTQLRMNGMGGSYSQILINGRPIFSPLTGLYGLEQIPVNMVEKIEVVRGGGSALYGSNAIGGTVNIFTKLPKENNFNSSFTAFNINGKANETNWNANATALSHSKKMAVSLFLNHRNRDYYDHNGDNFSELPSLKNYSFGTSLYYRPSHKQKLELNISSVNEYRYGGEMVSGPAYLCQQCEERTHNVLMGSFDYQNNFNEKNSLIVFGGAQQTLRNHYTGIIPDDSLAFQQHLELPPYGTSNAYTLQGGIQFNHKFNKFLVGNNVVTTGLEYLLDDVYDRIEAYDYTIDQTVSNVATYVQSDWELTPKITLLSGIRMDKHVLLNYPVINPRVSLMYKSPKNLQLRATWGKGFRAPQAFDTDMHIAFAGGGVSRIRLSEDLLPERSQSFSTSINYDRLSTKTAVGFTLEGFYNKLDHVFYLHPLGTDARGEVFEKRNGPTANIFGSTLELRFNYKRKLQIESGLTVQKSLYTDAILYSDELPAEKRFLRAPNNYGYATATMDITKRIKLSTNYTYTGSMMLLHLAGAPEQLTDAYIFSQTFHEVGFKAAYTVTRKSKDFFVDLYIGAKNLLNSYQPNFDTGKNRDSNFVFGPGLPRTFYFGIKLGSK